MDSVYADSELYTILTRYNLQAFFSGFRDKLKIRTKQQLTSPLTSGHLQALGMSDSDQSSYRELVKTLTMEKGQPVNHVHHGKMTKLKHYISSLRKKTHTTHASLAEDKTSPELINAADIMITKEVGSGRFGLVHKATWKKNEQQMEVAVKEINETDCTKVSELLTEAMLMQRNKHRNIITFYGIILSGDGLHKLVLEYAPRGCLLDCLREVRDGKRRFNLDQLWNFALQIAHALEYLSAMGIVHQDISCWKILVCKTNLVKLGDLGLSRRLLEKKSCLCVRNSNDVMSAWYAPETLRDDKIFSHQSDVWSYGVTLWEMLTFGKIPWENMSKEEILKTIDTPRSQRLQKMSIFPDGFYEVINMMWRDDPDERPTFQWIRKCLEEHRPRTFFAKDKCETKIKENLRYKPGEPLILISTRGDRIMWLMQNLYTGQIGLCCKFKFFKPLSENVMQKPVPNYVKPLLPPPDLFLDQPSLPDTKHDTVLKLPAIQITDKTFSTEREFDKPLCNRPRVPSPMPERNSVLRRMTYAWPKGKVLASSDITTQDLKTLVQKVASEMDKCLDNVPDYEYDRIERLGIDLGFMKDLFILNDKDYSKTVDRFINVWTLCSVLDIHDNFSSCRQILERYKWDMDKAIHYCLVTRSTMTTPHRLRTSSSPAPITCQHNHQWLSQNINKPVLRQRDEYKCNRGKRRSMIKRLSVPDLVEKLNFDFDAVDEETSLKTLSSNPLNIPHSHSVSLQPPALRPKRGGQRERSESLPFDFSSREKCPAPLPPYSNRTKYLSVPNNLNEIGLFETVDEVSVSIPAISGDDVKFEMKTMDDTDDVFHNPPEGFEDSMKMSLSSKDSTPSKDNKKQQDYCTVGNDDILSKPLEAITATVNEYVKCAKINTQDDDNVLYVDMQNNSTSEVEEDVDDSDGGSPNGEYLSPRQIKQLCKTIETVPQKDYEKLDMRNQKIGEDDGSGGNLYQTPSKIKEMTKRTHLQTSDDECQPFQGPDEHDTDSLLYETMTSTDYQTEAYEDGSLYVQCCSITTKSS